MEDKLDKLLRIEKENNMMLRKILKYLYTHNDDAKDFAMNYLLILYQIDLEDEIFYNE